MKNSEILSKAKELIETKGWTQGSYAKTSKGYDIGPTCKNAACYCAAGSLIAIVGSENKNVREIVGILNSFTPKYYDGDIVRYNDAPKMTKEKVLAKFDEAIAKAKELESE